MSQPKEIVDFPLFTEVAEQLKSRGVYQKDLTGSEVAGIMYGIAESLVAGRENVQASITSMSVQIENGQGKASGNVNVEKPLKAAIGLNCSLANDVIPGRIKLVDLDVKEEAGWMQRAALKFVNIKGRAQKALQDPNAAFTEALIKQLEPKGIALTDVQLQFTDASLAVSLKGKPTNS